MLFATLFSQCSSRSKLCCNRKTRKSNDIWRMTECKVKEYDSKICEKNLWWPDNCFVYRWESSWNYQCDFLMIWLYRWDSLSTQHRTWYISRLSVLSRQRSKSPIWYLSPFSFGVPLTQFIHWSTIFVTSICFNLIANDWNLDLRIVRLIY